MPLITENSNAALRSKLLLLKMCKQVLLRHEHPRIGGSATTDRRSQLGILDRLLEHPTLLSTILLPEGFVHGWSSAIKQDKLTECIPKWQTFNR
jgi:hypothetical protein